MKDEDIIQLVIDKLKRADGWFTTKLDKTYFDADVYYDLDEYGDLTEKGQKQVIKDLESFIGDGALDYTDAVDLWFDKAYGNNQIAGKDCLLTKFKPKQIVSQISAYEVKTESKVEEDVLTPIPDELKQQYLKVNKVQEERVHKQLSKGDIYKNSNGVEVRITSVDKEHLLDGEPQVTYVYGGNTTNKDYKCYKMSSVVAMLNQNGYKLQESKKVEENAKTRLKEQNNKSQNEITDKLEDEKFDAESNEGKMILATSNLFNVLSDKGFDVIVSFDNGESTSSILLRQQGGEVNITITNAELKIKPFVSGNFELTEENVKKLQDIVDTIQNI